MFELRVNLDARLTDALGGCLFEAGAGGVQEHDDDEGTWLVVYCESESEARTLERAVDEFRERVRSALPDAEVGPVQIREASQDWQATWLEALQPARLTDTLVLCPTHAAAPEDAKELLWYEASACFGSGDHPTTRLAARAVERVCQAAASSAGTKPFGLLDVGSGTGVLCFVGLRRGATRAVGVDIDPFAVTSAERNAALNDLAELCRFSTDSVADLTERFELVVANIDAPTLTELAPAIAGRLAPEGTLLLTGLLEEQVPEVLARYRALGCVERQRTGEGDWALLELSAPPAP